MDTKKLFGELEQSFGLRKNHILILGALTKDDYTADKLSKDTNIPMGRIYEFLNDLLELRLIGKKEGFPAVYFVGDLSERLLDFLRYQTDVVVAKEKRLLGLIESEKELEQTTIVNGREELAFMTMKTTLGAQEIRSIVKHETVPDIFYPFDENEFIKLRNYFGRKSAGGAIFKGGADPLRIQLFRTNKEAYASGRNIKYVMDRTSFDRYIDLLATLGKEKRDQTIKTVLDQLSQYKNVKVYVVEKDLPVSIRIYDKKRVLMRIVHLDAPLGIFIQSKKVAAFYNSFFEDLIGQATPAQKLIKGILRD